MPIWTKQIKVLAWDLDGTLYPPTSALEEIITDEIIAALASVLNCSSVKAQKYYSHKKLELKSSTKVLNSAGIDGHAFFTNIWKKMPLDHYIKPNLELQKLFTQSTQFIHFLHTNSNTLEVVQLKLNCLGLSIDNFAQILTFPREGYQKPDLQAFELLVKSTKKAEYEILYIGDREEVDLLPASQLGIHTALVTHGRQNKSSFQPDLVFETPVEVLRYFQNEQCHLLKD